MSLDFAVGLGFFFPLRRALAQMEKTTREGNLAGEVHRLLLPLIKNQHLMLDRSAALRLAAAQAQSKLS